MTILDIFSPELDEKAFEIVEQTLLAADWACERSEEGGSTAPH